MNKITVIHHSADYDGIFCREIARKFLPTATLIGWDFADKPLIPILDDDTRYYVLDLPVDRVFGLDFAKLQTADEAHSVCQNLIKKVIWIDHHKSSIDSHPPQFKGYRIDGVAACRLALQWFKYQAECEDKSQFKLPIKSEFVGRFVSEPYAVQLAGEYDIWDKRDPNAEVFQFGLRSKELVAYDWEQLLDNTVPDSLNGTGMEQTSSWIFSQHLLSNGQMLQRYQQSNDAAIVTKLGFIVEFEGLKFLAVNTTARNSLAFAARDIPETGHDALMKFNFTGEKWDVSMYHAKHRTDLDLSKIAVKYGGGGHRGACGFKADKLPFIP